MVLDTDLAAFYGETTKRFNQQVNRNLARFPPGFMLQLDEQEFANLRLQFATSSLKGSHGGHRYALLSIAGLCLGDDACVVRFIRITGNTRQAQPVATGHQHVVAAVWSG